MAYAWEEWSIPGAFMTIEVGTEDKESIGLWE